MGRFGVYMYIYNIIILYSIYVCMYIYIYISKKSEPEWGKRGLRNLYESISRFL